MEFGAAFNQYSIDEYDVMLLSIPPPFHYQISMSTKVLCIIWKGSLGTRRMQQLMVVV